MKRRASARLDKLLCKWESQAERQDKIFVTVHVISATQCVMTTGGGAERDNNSASDRKIEDTKMKSSVIFLSSILLSNQDVSAFVGVQEKMGHAQIMHPKHAQSW